MGTSSSFAGPSGTNPLVPTWVDDPDFDAPPADPQAPERPEENEPSPEERPDQGPPAAPPPSVPDASRFTAPRNNLSRFASSGGSDKGSLRRALGGYVRKSAGGAGTAARRMGASRVAAGRLLGFLADARERGVEAALRDLNLGQLVGKSAGELFTGLADYICPPGGGVDPGIAREAYLEAVIELVGAGSGPLDVLTDAQASAVFEGMVTNTIFTRICNDIGKGVVQLTPEVERVPEVQGQLKDFIRGAVRNAVSAAVPGFGSLRQSEVKRITTQVYKQAFSLIERLGRKGTR